jgi:hypothetical protein
MCFSCPETGSLEKSNLFILLVEYADGIYTGTSSIMDFSGFCCEGITDLYCPGK